MWSKIITQIPACRRRAFCTYVSTIYNDTYIYTSLYILRVQCKRFALLLNRGRPRKLREELALMRVDHTAHVKTYIINTSNGSISGHNQSSQVLHCISLILAWCMHAWSRRLQSKVLNWQCCMSCIHEPPIHPLSRHNTNALPSMKALQRHCYFYSIRIFLPANAQCNSSWAHCLLQSMAMVKCVATKIYTRKWRPDSAWHQLNKLQRRWLIKSI
jgi:hypothetical protein